MGAFISTIIAIVVLFGTGVFSAFTASKAKGCKKAELYSIINAVIQFVVAIIILVIAIVLL